MYISKTVQDIQKKLTDLSSGGHAKAMFYAHQITVLYTVKILKIKKIQYLSK